jgi:hypothetical protein
MQAWVLNCKHQTRLEGVARDKHSTKICTLRRKKFYNMRPIVADADADADTDAPSVGDPARPRPHLVGPGTVRLCARSRQERRLEIFEPPSRKGFFGAYF